MANYKKRNGFYIGYTALRRMQDAIHLVIVHHSVRSLIEFHLWVESLSYNKNFITRFVVVFDLSFVFSMIVCFDCFLMLESYHFKVSFNVSIEHHILAVYNLSWSILGNTMNSCSYPIVGHSR
jgi:hypothetical protein